MECGGFDAALARRYNAREDGPPDAGDSPMTHEDNSLQPAALKPADSGARREIPWPHAPTHRLSASGTYIVTVGTYRKLHHFRTRERLTVLHRGLLTIARDFGWSLRDHDCAWADPLRQAGCA